MTREHLLKRLNRSYRTRDRLMALVAQETGLTTERLQEMHEKAKEQAGLMAAADGMTTEKASTCQTTKSRSEGTSYITEHSAAEALDRGGQR